MLLIDSSLKLTEYVDGVFFMLSGDITHQRDLFEMHNNLLMQRMSLEELLAITEEKISRITEEHHLDHKKIRLLDWQIFQAVLLTELATQYAAQSDQVRADNALLNATKMICDLILLLSQKPKKADAYFIHLFQAFTLECKLARATMAVNTSANYSFLKHELDLFTTKALYARYAKMQDAFKLSHIKKLVIESVNGEKNLNFNEYFSSEINNRKTIIAQLYPAHCLYLIDQFRPFLQKDPPHIDFVRQVLAKATLPDELDRLISHFELTTRNTPVTSAYIDNLTVLKKLYLKKIASLNVTSLLYREFCAKLVSHQANLVDQLITLCSLDKAEEAMAILFPLLNEYVDYFHFLGSIAPEISRGMMLIGGQNSTVLRDVVTLMQQMIPRINNVIESLMQWTEKNHLNSIWTISINRVLIRHEIGKFVHVQAITLNNVVKETMEGFINFAVLHSDNSKLAEALYSKKKLSSLAMTTLSSEEYNQKHNQYLQELKAALREPTTQLTAEFERNYFLIKISLQDLKIAVNPDEIALLKNEINPRVIQMKGDFSRVIEEKSDYDSRVTLHLYLLEILIETWEYAFDLEFIEGVRQLNKIKTALASLTDVELPDQHVFSSDFFKKIDSLTLKLSHPVHSIHFGFLKENLQEKLRQVKPIYEAGELKLREKLKKKTVNSEHEPLVPTRPAPMPEPKQTIAKIPEMEMRFNVAQQLLNSEGIAKAAESPDLIAQFLSAIQTHQRKACLDSADKVIALRAEIKNQFSASDWQQFCRLSGVPQMFSIVNQAVTFAATTRREQQYYNAGAEDDLFSVTSELSDLDDEQSAQDDEIPDRPESAPAVLMHIPEVPQNIVTPPKLLSSEGGSANLSVSGSVSSSSSAYNNLLVETQYYLSLGLFCLKQGALLEAFPKLCFAINNMMHLTLNRFTMVLQVMDAQELSLKIRLYHEQFMGTVHTPVLQLTEVEFWNFVNAYVCLLTHNQLRNEYQANSPIEANFWFRMMQWGNEAMMAKIVISQQQAGWETPSPN